MPRRSTRLQALSGVASWEQEDVSNQNNHIESPSSLGRKKRKTAKAATTNKKSSKRKQKVTQAKSTRRKDNEQDVVAATCLPRTRECQLKDDEGVTHVLGIDEAGRGPLAGPVVAAAVIAPSDLAGIVDSKKITKEEEREALYEQLVAMKDIQWAVSVIDAARIDKINILQATLEGMRFAAEALVVGDETSSNDQVSIQKVKEASIELTGCYVVCPTSTFNKNHATNTTERYYALIDGNKVPKEMPCPAESIVKGDSREFSIAAASILAKVTRDRLMHGYDTLYPEYNLKQHKGYPTAAHMHTVKTHGASPIHRRTFAPLKYMDFDENGKVLKDNR